VLSARSTGGNLTVRSETLFRRVREYFRLD
jgi:hypothetical protein